MKIASTIRPLACQPSSEPAIYALEKFVAEGQKKEVSSVTFKHHHTTTNPFLLALAQSQYQFD